jgi:hypothetical protein
MVHSGLILYTIINIKSYNDIVKSGIETSILNRTFNFENIDNRGYGCYVQTSRFLETELMNVWINY